MALWFYCPECGEHISGFPRNYYLKREAQCKNEKCNWKGVYVIKKEKRIHTHKHIESMKAMGTFQGQMNRLDNLEESIRKCQIITDKLDRRMKQILLVFHLLLKQSEGNKKYNIKDLISFIDKIVMVNKEPNKPEAPIDLINELMNK
jgi:hypothetical protein